MKKQKKEREIENFFEVLIRNYKTVPGLRIVLKLGFYIIFIIIFVLVIMISNYSKKNDKIEMSTTTTKEVVESKKYRDMISDLSNTKKEFVIINDIKINLDIQANITGYLEMNDTIKKVIFKDNKLYEIIDGNEILNETLTDPSFIDINNVITYLFNNKSIRLVEENDTLYKYDLLNVYVNNDKITKVVVNNGYEINYE